MRRNKQGTSLSLCALPIALLIVLALDSLDLGLDFRCPSEDLCDVLYVVRVVVRDAILEERCLMQMPWVGDNSRVVQANPAASFDFCNLNRVESEPSSHFH